VAYDGPCDDDPGGAREALEQPEGDEEFDAVVCGPPDQAAVATSSRSKESMVRVKSRVESNSL
ncbi:hypothetical protein, partial [Streptomyces phaeochromogenes]